MKSNMKKVYLFIAGSATLACILLGCVEPNDVADTTSEDQNAPGGNGSGGSPTTYVYKTNFNFILLIRQK